MGQTVVKALSLVAIIALGYLCKRIGVVRREHFAVLTRIVLRVTLPCALVTNFNGFQLPGQLAWLIVIGLATILIQEMAGLLVTRGKPIEHRAFAWLNIGTFNLGAFALPYIGGMLGPQATIYSTLFDIGDTVQAAGIGYGVGVSMANGHASPLRIARKMFSSVLFDTYLFLLLMAVFHIVLPGPILEFTSTVGASNTFLTMFMIGVGLEIKLPGGKYKAAAYYLSIRYLISAVIATICWFLPFPREVRVVLVMVLFAPIAAMTPAFTAEAGGDVELSTFMNSVSILIAIVAVPVIAITLS